MHGEKRVGYDLGVDLGTTYTAAATRRDGRTEIATLGTRSPSIPSVVYLRADGQLLVGEAALRRETVEPDRLAREFKRRMGDQTPILVGGSPLSATALTARLLAAVVSTVVADEGGEPDHLIVTCPANWGRFKRDLLAQAVELAGTCRGDDATIVSEPEAVAAHYAAGARVEPGELVAVYDLGGGTFDAAVLVNTGDGHAVLGDPTGVEQLGGSDFDDAVLAYVAEQLAGATAGLDPDDPAVLRALVGLRRACVEAKEALSYDTEVAVPVVLPTLQTQVRLTRGEFERLIGPTLAVTLAALDRALRAANVAPGDLAAVVTLTAAAFGMLALATSDPDGRAGSQEVAVAGNDRTPARDGETRTTDPPPSSTSTPVVDGVPPTTAPASGPPRRPGSPTTGSPPAAPPGTTSPPAAPGPTLAPPDPGPQWHDVATGACLDDLNADPLTVTAVAVVGCDTAHEYEALGVLSKAPGPYPGAGGLVQEATDWCTQVRDFVNSFHPDLVLGLAVGIPTAPEWDRGVQELGCFLGLADGSRLTRKIAG